MREWRKTFNSNTKLQASQKILIDDFGEEHKVKKEQGKFIISITDPKKVYWDLYIIFLALYNAFSIPIEVSFEPEAMSGAGFTAINWIVDFCFLLDIIITFRTSYFNSNYEEVFKTK